MTFLTRLRRSLAGPPGRALLKLAVYSAVCIAVLGALISAIGNRPIFGSGTTYEAVLPDATGLFANDAVKVAGVQVGHVTGIEVERGMAVVSFSLERDLGLTTTTRTGIRWRNVLGQKYLYLYPDDGGETIEEGDRLPPENAVGSAEVGALLNAVAPVLRAIDPAKANLFIRTLNDALAGNEERVRDLLTNTATLSRDVSASDEQIGTLIEDLDTVVGAVAERDRDIEDLIGNVGSVSDSLAARAGDLEDLVLGLVEVQTHLNDLLEQREGDIEGVIGDLDTIAGTLAQHRDDLEEGLATFPAGLAPYHRISAYGQWFQVRLTVTCLANQATCTHESVATDALGSVQPPAPAGGAGLLDSVFGFASQGVPAP
ncbi:MCE family protein [Iamia sp. SCSIO 61187]|uniref:MCE family protein n=1 Tax=Iamia sp. SCSIO 61187 TaxID=2722752 RepID=UPI001C63AFA3|nr:MCE family protein [Iamia sp. SCSIO 61187]QYG92927.1 MCE family protein [Iamia sp. SCSIO 61187]